ncbi:MAG: hypothetical protein DYG89_33540 [Caldilinea sp. CFX5]|nr:hypothetical protein [Caldilinea sp. CFX5]
MYVHVSNKDKGNCSGGNSPARWLSVQEVAGNNHTIGNIVVSHCTNHEVRDGNIHFGAGRLWLTFFAACAIAIERALGGWGWQKREE